MGDRGADRRRAPGAQGEARSVVGRGHRDLRWHEPARDRDGGSGSVYSAQATMKLPNGDRAVVELAKLTDYCLDPGHPRGRHKARAPSGSMRIPAR